MMLTQFLLLWAWAFVMGFVFRWLAGRWRR